MTRLVAQLLIPLPLSCRIFTSELNYFGQSLHTDTNNKAKTLGTEEDIRVAKVDQ